jgi:hypothetical protein
MPPSEIDWAPFDAYPENTCECACGVVYQSHSKFVMAPSPHLEARKPCPACGETRLVNARSDPEAFTL